MLVFKHPKFYEEIRKRAKREQELERKRASERARRGGGPTSHEQGSERASKLNADNSERFVEGARSQALKRSTER